jgi:transaldolase
MKLFLDSANLEEIKAAQQLGVLAGVTTNPTLVAKSGLKFEDLLQEISACVKGPISAEVLGRSAEEMFAEGQKLAAISEQIVIKLPMTEEGLKAVRLFSQQGIATNVTLVFTASQALLAALAGASYVSLFIGRLDDISHAGLDQLAETVQIFAQHRLASQVLAASIRHPQHVIQAALLGAHIATIPYKVLTQMLQHPLTREGIACFEQDWQKRQI